jgi:hypothetical protein
MAYEIPGFSYPLPAAADYSASQFRFVNVSAAGKAVVAGAGGRVCGVRNNKPKADEATTIVQTGISIVEAGAAVTAGDSVQSDASGRAITLAAGIAQGIALETASAAGVFIAVLLVPRVA